MEERQVDPTVPLRIGFDAKRAAYNGTGLGNYSRFVIAGLAEAASEADAGGDAETAEVATSVDAEAASGAEAASETEVGGDAEGDADAPAKAVTGATLVMAAASKKRRPPLAAYLGLLKRFPERIKTIAPKGLWVALPSLWRRYGMGGTLSKAGIRLYHGLSNELPVGLRRRGIRSIVTIHDLIFLFYPQFYRPLDRLIYRFKFRSACRQADRVLAISECTKRDIMHCFGIPEDKIRVIYQGCEPTFGENPGPSVTTAVRRRHGIPEEFLLFVGSIEERKNLRVVVEALACLRETHPNLHIVAVGRRTAYTTSVEKRAAALGLSDRLHCLHGIPDEELRAFYHAARLFVYPSRYEGFGIPLVEAIHAGLPVLAATGSCLEEAGGPACRYMDPDNAPAWADAIADLLKDADARHRMVTESQAYVQRFNRHDATRQLLALYAEVLNI